VSNSDESDLLAALQFLRPVSILLLFQGFLGGANKMVRTKNDALQANFYSTAGH